MFRISFVLLLAILFSFISLGQSTETLDKSPEKHQKQVEDSLLEVARKQSNLYRKSNVSIEFQDTEGRPKTGLRVTARHIRHNFRFGSQMDPDFFNPANMGEPSIMLMPFDKVCNYVVYNPFCWGRWEPQPGQTDQSIYGPPLEWARENNYPVKGHTLAWPLRSQLPEWVFGMPAEQAEDLLIKRIEDITREFQGVIDEWDVVNEPLHSGPWEAVLDTNLLNPQMPRSLEVIQELADYIEKCHRAAYRGNPDGFFILNEYENYSSQEIRTLYYLLVRELQSRKVPLHAIGLESDSPPNQWHDPRVIWDTWNSYADLKLPIHITEVRIQSGDNPITGGWRQGIWDENAQSRYAELLLRMAFGHPSVDVFVWWGLSDSHIWVEKPVYRMVDKLINQEWKTSVDLHTDFNGWIAFRGFNGTYQVDVWDGKKKLGKYEVKVSKDEMNTWTFVLE